MAFDKAAAALVAILEGRMTLAAQLIGGSMLLISAAWIAWEIHIAPVMDEDTGTGLDTYVPPLALFGSSHSQSSSVEAQDNHAA